MSTSSAHWTMKKHLVTLSLAVLTLAVHGATVPAGVKRVRAGESVTYVAAVLEYEPYDQWTDESGGEAITVENAKIFVEYAAAAKAQGADIMVAPEYGVQSLTVHPEVFEEFFSFMQYVPDPALGAVPCDTNGDNNNLEALRILSCAARLNQLYLVVDLGEASPCTPETATNNPFNNTLDTTHDCPATGYIFYNSQVVFDRTGTVIARYRKKNLYGEPYFTPGDQSDATAIFVTDFGVRFTLQVCFDIGFPHPGVANVETLGVKDVAMSTAWVDILPFAAAPSVHNGWTRHLGVNLLVSGFHRPEIAKLGSGIYRGFSDLTHDYVYDPDSGNKMIVSEVETIAATDGIHNVAPRSRTDTLITVEREAGAADDNSVVGKRQPRRAHLLLYDDLSNYTHVVLAGGSSDEAQEAKVCHEDELCCSLTYTSLSNLNYSLMAYSGIITQGAGYLLYVQVCALAWCRTEDINTCSHISEGLPPEDEVGSFLISGTFSTEYVFPVLITRNLTIVDNDLYSVTPAAGGVHKLETEQHTDNLLVAGFYGRWYDRDP